MENIIQQGELLKYIVTSQDVNFDMETDDFTVEITSSHNRTLAGSFDSAP